MVSFKSTTHPANNKPSHSHIYGKFKSYGFENNGIENENEKWKMGRGFIGNLSIVVVIIADHGLHTPMYFLLGNLSFLDFFYATTTVPKLLSGLLVEDKKITFEACIVQLHIFHFLGSTEAMLLMSMSYDRFIATHIQNMRSENGRSKALSTCTSHLTVVLLYYGTAFCTYLRPVTKDSLEQDRLTAILFTVITPALNPIIYALRNKDVKKAFKKLFFEGQIFVKQNDQKPAIHEFLLGEAFIPFHVW
ncbi:unnamed protein product [Ranitomeya imitator]|uniref:G-protein coupled receptors family 1 profile domain-containing protein n=1 Tax=Ranitomeya imitator TaxID=111125 RepID=A0ABN9LSW6_9NEOB|nr:unnamed protein product [Ranitomeya imitator]